MVGVCWWEGSISALPVGEVRALPDDVGRRLVDWEVGGALIQWNV
jgi:hypothetical protein